jgi:hypothetical protein
MRRGSATPSSASWVGMLRLRGSFAALAPAPLSMTMGLIHDIGIHYPLLLQVMGDRVLSQQRRLQADFGADPFAFVVGGAGSVVAAAAAAELRAEVGLWISSYWRISRHASSPTVPLTSILSLTTAIPGKLFHHRVTEAQRKNLGFLCASVVRTVLKQRTNGTA